MILHDLTPGMHPRRVRIFIAEKGLAIERREVDAAGKANATPEFPASIRWESCRCSNSMTAARLPNPWRSAGISKRCIPRRR